MDNLVDHSWVEDFQKQLRAYENGVDKFCERVGIDFHKTFIKTALASNLSENPYRDYTWIAFPHSLIPTGVLHAFHKDYRQHLSLPWEEWLLWEGKAKHNSLYQIRLDSQQQVFDGELNDTEHPTDVLGQPWYCTVEEHLTPRLFI